MTGSKERFNQLIRDFCTLSGTDDATHILNGGSIAINDIVFLLAWKERLDPERLYVRCDFGEVPANRKIQVCKSLLEADLDLYDGSGPAFSLSATTGRVLFTHSYRLDALTPAELRDILSALVDSVLEWRSGHFLEPLPLYRAGRAGFANSIISGRGKQA